MMVFFNDPVPMPDPQASAVRLALAMRDCMADLTARWRDRYDCDLGFGVGIDHDFANLGRIGFERRYDYAAVGPVTNRAARLCAEATDGQILVTRSLYAAVEDWAAAEYLGEIDLKGFGGVRTYNITDAK
jgi:class 3 adenylate cyclase